MLVELYQYVIGFGKTVHVQTKIEIHFIYIVTTLKHCPDRVIILLCTHMYIDNNVCIYANLYVLYNSKYTVATYVHTFHRLNQLEEQSFAFTNAFTTAGEGSVIELRKTYSNMQTNYRPAANREHKKFYKGTPFPILHHTMV